MAERITQIYNQFRGVDLRGGECAPYRSPDALNVWRDYKDTAGIQTRPSTELLTRTEQEGFLGGIFPYKNELVFQYGLDLYAYDMETKKVKEISPGGVNFLPEDVVFFVFAGKLYVLCWTGAYVVYDGEECREVDPYVPTTTIGKAPSGSGEKHEDVNLLTQKRINTFKGDGESTTYQLDVEEYSWIDEIRIAGEVLDKAEYTQNREHGKVEFKTAPPKAENGKDNVEIKFTAGPLQEDKILGCTIATVFDNRVFFSGNQQYPNMLWHSSLDDPTYVSDLDYYQEGKDDAQIRSVVAGNNALWVFREPTEEQTTVFYHVPSLSSEYGKVYPSAHSSISLGCVGRAINFNDDIVFFSQRGMEGISGDITSEQVVAHRSSLVDRLLLQEPEYGKNMKLVEWNGYLLAILGQKIYLADSRAMFQNEDHVEYEWFVWDMGTKITCAAVKENVLYLGTQDGSLYRVTGNESVHSYWTTAKEKFQNPNRLKTTNKRGCVAEATGDVAVYAKTEDTDFEQIAEHKGVTDYFVSRIKRKKFKDIQLKFQSDTRFSLESVTLEAFIGGYIKR